MKRASRKTAEYEPAKVSEASDDEGEEERMLKERLRQLKENKRRAKEARSGGPEDKAV